MLTSTLTGACGCRYNNGGTFKLGLSKMIGDGFSELIEAVSTTTGSISFPGEINEYVRQRPFLVLPFFLSFFSCFYILFLLVCLFNCMLLLLSWNADMHSVRSTYSRSTFANALGTLTGTLSPSLREIRS